MSVSLLSLLRKADLLNRGKNDTYKDKNWLLLKEWHISLNTIIRFKVCELLGYCWTPAWQYVNVLFNGEYRGVYLLTESVRRNQKCRINVSEEGFIIERNAYWWNEEVSFGTNSMDTRMRYTFKYPDGEEISPAQIEYVKGELNQLEEGIADGHYEDRLDVNSFACWLLGHDFLGTSDASGSNQFISKYDDNCSSPFRMETLWDFDLIMESEGIWSAVRGRTASYYTDLFTSPNKAFAKAYVRKWETEGHNLTDHILQFLANYADSSEALAVDRSYAREAEIWNKTYCSVKQNIENACEWFASRMIWMDEQVLGIDTVDNKTGMKSIIPDSDSGIAPSSKVNVQCSKFYDLSGRRISAPPAQGLYIEDGKVKAIHN